MSIADTFNAPWYTAGTASTTEVPSILPVAIGGRAYLVDVRGIKRQSLPIVRQQSDTSSEPGEFSLSPYDLWRRSTSDFSFGALQEWYDLPDSDKRRFRISKGIDPWTKGKLKLLPGTTLKRASANTNTRGITVGTYVYHSDGTKVERSTDLAAWTDISIQAGEGAQTVQSITTNGFEVWAALGVNGVHKTDRGITTSSHFSDLQAQLIAYVRGRLMASKDNVLYNITASGAAPIDLFTHPNTDFRFTGFAEAVNQIYACGFTGDKSVVYRTTIKADGTALDKPVVALELPDGEIARSMGSYLGLVFIGTDKGVRMAKPDTNEDLVAGALIPTTSAVECFEGQDRFVWFGQCVPPDTLILDDRGCPIAIQEIRVGDHVLTGMGRARKVLNTFVRPYRGELIQIRIRGYPFALRFTPEHKIPTQNGWKQAKDIALGDTLSRPRLSLEDGGDYEDGWLVGAFLAEGTLDQGKYVNSWKSKVQKRGRNRVRFGIHKKEIPELVSRLESFVKRHNLKPHHHSATLRPQIRIQQPNGAAVSLTAPVLRELIDEWVGGSRAPVKHLMKLPLVHEFARGIWDGWMWGDGFESVTTNAYRKGQWKISQGVTTSRALAHQMQLIAGTLGIPAPMSYARGGHPTILNGKATRTSPLYYVGALLPNPRASRQLRIENDTVSHVVKSIEREPYDGYVYDLEVDEDHTFITGCVRVSNSNYDSTSTGLGRMDLLHLTEGIAPAFATDLMATVQGAVLSVFTLAGKRGFTVSGSGLHYEDTNLVASGELRTGKVTYALTGSKVWKFLVLTTESVPAGAVIDRQLDVDGVLTAVSSDMTLSGNRLDYDARSAVGEAAEAIITLKRGTVATTGPVLNRWTLRSLPIAPRGEQIELPLLLKESILERTGRERPINPQTEFNALKSMEKAGLPTTIQIAEESFEGFLDAVSWGPDLSFTADGSSLQGSCVILIRRFD